MDILVNERNVFRKARSCLDHNYMLVSAIKNRINIKLDTFCASIDLGNHLNCVSRELQLYKLLMYDIGGHMFKVMVFTMSLDHLSNLVISIPRFLMLIQE